MRTLNIALIASIGVLLLASGKAPPAPKADAAPVASSQPAPLTEAQFAELQAALKKVRDAENELNALYERLKTLEGENRSLKDQRDRALLKQSSIAPVRPQAVAYVTAVPRKAAPQPAAGQWVNVPVYGPLGRQRGTRREWQSNQPMQRIQFRGNCANGVCR